MATKIITAWVDGEVQQIEVEDIISEEQITIEDRLVELEDKHPIVEDGNFLVGNGTDDMVEVTPEYVLSHINGASVAPMTTNEFDNLESINANTLYLITDSEEDSSSTDIPFFDLTEMGLGVIPSDGTVLEVTGEDLTEIVTAMQNGPVRLGFIVNIGINIEMAATMTALCSPQSNDCRCRHEADLEGNGIFTIDFLFSPNTNKFGAKATISTPVELDIPFFDLTEMGLPEIPINGTVVLMDSSGMSDKLSSMKPALDKGLVKFGFILEGTEYVTTLNTMNAPSDNIYQLQHYIGNGSSIIEVIFNIDFDEETFLSIAYTYHNGGSDNVTPEVFSLVEMGLPVIPITGDSVNVTGVDLSALGLAFAEGEAAIVYAVAVDSGGIEQIHVSQRISPQYITEENCWQITHILNDWHNSMILIINFWTGIGKVEAKITPLGGSNSNLTNAEEAAF